jgi:NDP-sugar pyrophosphorylase family protein
VWSQVGTLYLEFRLLRPSDFFDLSDPIAAALFDGCDYVWQVLPRLADETLRLTGDKQHLAGEIMPGAIVSDRPIYLAPGARIDPGAYVLGPAYIGPGVVIRHGAFVRENVIMLPGSMLGHASEAKNALFFPNAHAPHFNYVGDSVLGNGVNLGAGAKLSNLAMNNEKDPETGVRPTIKLNIDGQEYDMGVAKMGAIMGDGAQTGCNAVLNPGCLVGRGVMIYPGLSLRKAYYEPDIIVKLRQNVRRVPIITP